MSPDTKNRPWWAYFDTALLLAILGMFVKDAQWKGDFEQWRKVTTEQVQMLATQQITPQASRDIAVLSSRVDGWERSQAELKRDLVQRLDRQDQMLQRIAERIDNLRNGK